MSTVWAEELVAVSPASPWRRLKECNEIEATSTLLGCVLNSVVLAENAELEQPTDMPEESDMDALTAGDVTPEMKAYICDHQQIIVNCILNPEQYADGWTDGTPEACELTQDACDSLRSSEGMPTGVTITKAECPLACDGAWRLGPSMAMMAAVALASGLLQ